MTDINPITINDLIQRKNPITNISERYKFIIPDYQRGYRWDESNVITLLNDFDDFKKHYNNDDFYCLQPIVVNKISTEDNVVTWEVIDGQQRLITLYIIISYFSTRYTTCYSIEFQQRLKSNDFLFNLVKNGVLDHSNPDFHYMSQAYSIITQWFDQKISDDNGYYYAFTKMLYDNVKVLFYEVDFTNVEERQHIFERLNIGKIPLTDSELIKALILSRIRGDMSARELNIRQSEISYEWQHIEQELRKPEKWLFLNVNESKQQYSSRIEFLFDLIAKNHVTKSNYATYLFFDDYISGKKTLQGEVITNQSSTQENNYSSKLEEEADRTFKIWDEVKRLFSIINSWFTTEYPKIANSSLQLNNYKATLYHYIGYLLIKDRSNLTQIIHNSTLDKSDFLVYLKSEVKKTITVNDITTLTYEENKNEIKNILLLFNILTCKKLCEQGEENRFPFYRYQEIENQGGWSIEHIHAQQSQDPITIKTKKDIQSWIHNALSALENIDEVDVFKTNEDGTNFEEPYQLLSIKASLSDLESKKELGSDDIDTFNDLCNTLIAKFSSQTMHDISNLALLSKNDNSALNNSIFPVKRSHIINMEKSGKYIPLCTRNVFLKFYSKSIGQPYYWSLSDKEDYLKEIQDVLSELDN